VIGSHGIYGYPTARVKEQACRYFTAYTPLKKRIPFNFGYLNVFESKWLCLSQQKSSQGQPYRIIV
jgi:hypothetical protein